MSQQPPPSQPALITKPPIAADASGPVETPTSHLYKFGTIHPLTGTPTRHRHAHVWRRQRTNDGRERLVITPNRDAIGLMAALSRYLPEPLGALYVLLVSRRRAHETGRYQQEEAFHRREEAEMFLREYQEFFENDARHTIWLLSRTAGQARLVYDRHDVLYAYGPLEEFADALGRLGLRQAESDDEVAIPAAHTHHYHAEYDVMEMDLLARRAWLPFPLVDEVDNR